MNGAPLALGSLAALAIGGAVGDAITAKPRPLPVGSRDAVHPGLGLGLLLLGGAATGTVLLWSRRAHAETRARTPALDTTVFTSPPAVPVSQPPASTPLASSPGAPSTAGDDAFYRAILAGIAAPVSENALTFLRAWRQAEGGKATYNPFNTTWKKPGTTDYNSRGVKNYPDPATGLSATVKTLLSSSYSGIVDALRRGAPSSKAASALRASPWGTGAGVERVLATGKVAPPSIGTVPGAPAIASVDPQAVA